MGRNVVYGGIAIGLVVLTATTFSQSGAPLSQAEVVSAAEIERVKNVQAGGDREVKIFDMGRYNLGVAVLHRAATKPGAPLGAINHSKITEVYYVTSGGGTLIAGGEVKDVKPIAADNELVTTVVGPGNNAIFVKPGMTRKIGVGDVVVIPPGVYHGFAEVPDHIDYVSVRPDMDKVLPGGYVHPSIK